MINLASRIVDTECQVIDYLNNHIQSKWLDYIMKLVTNLGGAIFTISLGLILVAGGSQALGLQALSALTFSHLLVQLLKFLVSRPRPFLVLPSVHLCSKPLKDHSFPSGHSTAAFSIASVMAMTFVNFSPVFILLASIVAVSRVYLGLHYPSDVAVGSLLGIIAGLMSYAII